MPLEPAQGAIGGVPRREADQSSLIVLLDCWDVAAEVEMAFRACVPRIANSMRGKGSECCKRVALICYGLETHRIDFAVLRPVREHHKACDRLLRSLAMSYHLTFEVTVVAT